MDNNRLNNLKNYRPWENEPDHFVEDLDGFKVAIIRDPDLGFLCGYVGIPEGHPLYAKYYDIEDARNLQVHGGITFSGWYHDLRDQETEISDRLKYWYLGFDAGHAFDLMPYMSKIGFDLGISVIFPKLASLEETYRTFDYMYNECKSLVEQLEKES